MLAKPNQRTGTGAQADRRKAHVCCASTVLRAVQSCATVQHYGTPYTVQNTPQKQNALQRIHMKRLEIPIQILRG